MSAPQTNVERQSWRHRGPLIGIVAVLLFVGVIGTIILMWGAQDTPETGMTAPDPATTGETVPGLAPDRPLQPDPAVPVEIVPGGTPTPVEPQEVAPGSPEAPAGAPATE